MANKKKILIRIGSLRHGGAEKVLVTFLKKLPEDAYEIDLLLNLYSGKYLTEVPDFVNVLYLHKGEMITTNRLQDIPRKAFRVIYQKILAIFPKLLYRFILKNKKYDIEFAAIHGMRDAILSSPLKSSKKIVWIHNDLTKTEFHTYTENEFRKFFGFDKILVISKKIQQDFEKFARNTKDRAKIVRIYNPLDTGEILIQSKMPVNHDFFKMPTPTFISIGTAFPQKGFDRLLRSHRRLLDEGFRHQVLILGDGYDLENLKKLQKELNLKESSSFLGFVANPYPYLQQADYFVLSSRYEGFPTVLFEALTFQKKMIATEVSGVGEMLQDGTLGLIVENSEEGLYRGLKTALETPRLFDTYLAAINTYEMPFSLEKSVRRIKELIDSL